MDLSKEIHALCKIEVDRLRVENDRLTAELEEVRSIIDPEELEQRTNDFADALDRAREAESKLAEAEKAVDELLCEMRACLKYDAAPFDSDDGDIEDGMGYKEIHNCGILHATDWWRTRMCELMEEEGVPLEVER